MNGHINDPNGIIPGTTFPDKASQPYDSPISESPLSFPGPDVRGRETTVTAYSPQQLRHSPLLPTLYEVINEAFNAGHQLEGENLLKGTRLRYDGQLFDELGNGPGTFTYIIYFSGTSEVIGTASGKRYLGRGKVVDVVDHETARANTWRRYGPVPAGTIAYELSTMAIDPKQQRQGIAGFLMKLCEDEMKRRFKLLADEAEDDAKPTQLLEMLTSVKEKNMAFYARRGFVMDYETAYPKGWFDSDNGECIVSLKTCE